MLLHGSCPAWALRSLWGLGLASAFAPKTALASARDRQGLQVCVWFLWRVPRGLSIMNNKSYFVFLRMTACKALFLRYYV